jgi:hypothetical protein
VTHEELTTRAVRWLKTTQRCGVVFREHYMFHEVPDALGYRHSWSICVECKTSMSDFRADQQKRSRRGGYSERPAVQCYYLCPPGLILPGDLPEGWGLLYAEPRIVRVVAQAKPDGLDDRTPDQLRRELARLYCDIRRYHAQGLHYEPLRVINRRRRGLLP